MNIDIGKIISECLNNALIQHYFMKKREMTYDEKELQEKNFSRMIGYCVLFKESEGIEEYMHLTDEKQQIQFLKLRIADKIGIPHHEIDSKIEAIISYAFENFVRNGYVFHAGNSKAIENNMKYGLGFSQSSKEDKMELMHIASIYNKYGNDKPLGWGTLDIKNGKNGWFYDSTPHNMLYYSSSPEWFGQFCGENHCYAWGLVPEENRHGYENKDYDTCLLTITKLIEKNNMSEEDRKEILDFFNKCWNKFGNTEPYLAFVPISSLEDNDDINRMKSFYFPSMSDNSLYSNENYIFSDIVKGGSMLMGDNICCDKVVNPEVLSCVNLSPILPRFKVSEASKQREMTIQDCIRKLNDLDMEFLLKAQEMLSQFPSRSNGRSL